MYTREALPQYWAVTQYNLAISYRAWASILIDLKMYENAVTTYQDSLACHRALTEYAENKQDWNSAQVLELNCISWCQLFLKQYQAALESSEQALQLDPSKAIVQTNRAHALLLLGRYDEAKAIYLQYAKEDLGNGKTFAQTVLEDFDALEEAGITHPDMARIRRLLRGE